MNQAQIHLALTHMPVILSMTGLVILIISLIMKNTVVIKTSFYIFFDCRSFHHTGLFYRRRSRGNG